MVDRIRRLQSSRPAALISVDVFAWVAAFVGLSSLQRVAGELSVHPLADVFALGVCCGVVFVVLGWPLKVHLGRSAVGSFEDAVLVGSLAGVVGVVQLVVNYVLGPFSSGPVVVLAPIVALALMIWIRALYRVARERPVAPSAAGRKIRAIVVGAGDAGDQLVRSMLREPDSQWEPVALLDDDRGKRHRRLRGIAVVGQSTDLVEVAAEVGASAAIVAIPSAPADLMRQLSTLAREAGVDLKVLPKTSELLNTRRVAISDLRDIDVTDLLGRHQIDTDVASIADYLTDKRVLVTGAGGSIGSELCRQIAKFGPAELMMLDRDESALHAVELSIYGKAMLDTDETVLGDIRDTVFIHELFEERRPQVVFHAAALKHLPLLEKAPGEAIKTNVWGTLTLLEAAAEFGVDKFVNISTDKAANPSSVLGYSKRLAEGLTAGVADGSDGTFLSVRFGNVLGSRGSVLTAFTAQIAAGGPITVTDPRITRYFMTIQEAVQLVIQAAAIGGNGEVLILDMGDPVSIDSVARQLIEMSGQDVEIIYTGMRHGEKLHEELFGDGEVDTRSVHRLISHAAVPRYDSLEARALDPWASRPTILGDLRSACAALESALQARGVR